MEAQTLTLSLLKDQQLPLISFALMILSFLSLWVKQTSWLWAPILGISYILALISSLVQWFTIIPIAFLLLCHLGLKFRLPPAARYFLAMVAFMLSLGLKLEIIRGFSSVVFATNVQHTPSSLPYDLWFNYGTPFIGIFTLALNHDLLKGKEWIRFTYTGLIWALLTSCIIIFIFFSAKWIAFHPRFNLAMAFWYLLLVFLQIIPEEGFFRGFLQKEMSKIPIIGMNIISFILIGILYGICGLFIAPTLTFFVLSFCISILLSILYHYTKQIETSIITRVIIHFVHFFLFSYPILN